MSDSQIPGTDGEEARLDAALREYLAARLDGQLGRSAAHFYSHLRGEAGKARRGRGPLGGGPGGWVVGIVGGALAASIAALWAGPSLRMLNPGGPGGQGPAVAASDPRPADPGMDLRMEELTLATQTRDGGTVLLDDRTAARRVIRRELKQTRWVDPATGASVEQFEPRQDIMLIQLETY